LGSAARLRHNQMGIRHSNEIREWVEGQEYAKTSWVLSEFAKIPEPAQVEAVDWAAVINTKLADFKSWLLGLGYATTGWVANKLALIPKLISDFIESILLGFAKGFEEGFEEELRRA